MLGHDAGPITFTLTLDAITFDFVSFTVSEKSPHTLGDTFCDIVKSTVT